MDRRRRLILFVTALSLSVALAGTGASALAEERPEPPAASVIVVDAASGEILVDKSSGQRLDPGQLTELFTAFFALETTPFSQHVTISPADVLSGTAAGLRAGEQVSIDTLVNAMLLANGDDASLAVARSLGSEPGLTHRQSVDQFVTRMNARLSAVGLTATQLVTPYGASEAGHVSSARDIAALVVYAMRHEPGLIERLAAGSYNGDGHVFTTQNPAAQGYAGLLGGIAGESASLQIAERDGRTLVSVVLDVDPGVQSAALATQMLDSGFAVPQGSASGRIAFPNEVPIGQPAASTQYAVTTLAQGTAQVHGSTTASADIWAVIKWPLAAVLTMIVLLTCCVQVRALQRLNRRPPARQRVRRRARRPAPRTQPAGAYRENPRDRPVYLPEPGYSSGIAD